MQGSRKRVRPPAPSDVASVGLADIAVGPDDVLPIIARHRLAVQSISAARALSSAMRESINVGTLGGYKSACKSYFNWCEVRAITPWPVDEILLAAFCVHMGTSLTVASIRGYACAIKFIQLQLSPYEWTCDSSVVVRQALRWLKKRYGETGKAAKYPITLAVLRAILPLLPGWPVAADMSHDDRLFTCASLIGTSAFLRGGEFLTYSGSARAVLLGRAVRVHTNERGAVSVVVSIPTPKNAWWLDSVDANCFTPTAGHGPSLALGLLMFFGPAHWLRKYRGLSTVELSELDPAFRMADGATLSRNWMVKRTAGLIARAGLQVLGPSGEPIVVKASSWRSGGGNVGYHGWPSGPADHGFWPMAHHCMGIICRIFQPRFRAGSAQAVSYTPLTPPTNRRV